MYDGITCVIPWEQISNQRSSTDYQFQRNVRNIRISHHPDGICLKGSLAKFLNGQNRTTLTRDEVKEALSLLETESGLDLRKGKVYGIEVGATILVEFPPSAYLATWQDLSRYTKQTYEGTRKQSVTYISTGRSFIGYDKGREARSRNIRDFALRLELKIKKNMKSIHGRYLSPWEMSELEPYRELVRLWHKYYFMIPKRNLLLMDTANSTPRVFEKSLAFIGLQVLGIDTTLSIINGTINSGSDDRSKRCRLKTLLSELQKHPQIATTDELTRELDTKVNEACSNVR